MVVKKDIQLHSASLAQAKKEFQEFKDNRKSLPFMNPSSQPEILLYCASKAGERSRLQVTMNGARLDATGAVKAARDPSQPDKAQTSGHQPTITRQLGIGHTYKGCPHCGNGSFIYCGCCKTISCWDTATNEHCCPVCANTATVNRNGTGIHLEISDSTRPKALLAHTSEPLRLTARPKK